MFKPIFRLPILCIILIVSSLSISAATLTVSNTNDSGAGSLRQAVIDAASGDVIDFSITGTITLSTAIVIDKDLTILGPGATNLTIDGNNNSRIFEVASGRTVTIFGMNLQNGNSATDGGAIENLGTLTINTSTLSGNSAVSGGAIENRGILTINNTTLSGANSASLTGGAIENLGTLTVNNSTLSGNSATGASGGAIFNHDTLTINNSTLSGNSAGVGGAIYNNFTGTKTATIKNSTLSGNSSSGSGGAIHNNTSTLTIVNSTFSGNSGGSGGAIFNFRGILTISDSTFSANDGGFFGGAIYSQVDSTVIVNNSTFSGNFVGTRDGGAIHNFTSIMTINNSTISGNSTSDEGGGIINTSNATMTINNSTISGNSASSGGGIHNIQSTITLRNSIVSGNTGGDCQLIITTFNADANNIFGTGGNDGGCTAGTSDIVPGLGVFIGAILDSLASNGGTTQTRALAGSSLAIDASGTGALATDQRGVPAQSTRDIGAFEDGANPTYPIVQFNSTGATYNETDGTVTIGLTISAPVNFTGIAEVYVSDAFTGSATSGLDYTAFPFTSLSIDCSSMCPTTATVSLNLLTDSVLDNNEIANLTLVGTNGFATIGTQSTFAATILDTTTATTTISANDADATENPIDNGQFTVDLGTVNSSGSAIAVNYSISGTATNTIDYTSISGTVDVSAGQQTAIINIAPLDDIELEGDETVELTLTGTSQVSVGVDTNPATVTIADDERSLKDDVTDSTGDPIQSLNSNSDAQWSISISANPPFVQGGETVVFIIEILKLSGGTPVTMELPLPSQFTIQSVSSNRGNASFSGQTVTFSDDIHVGDTPIITVTTVLDTNLSLPFAETVQTCIVSPTNLCASITLAQVLELPATGETPIWRNSVLLLLALSGLLVLGGARAVFFRRIG